MLTTSVNIYAIPMYIFYLLQYNYQLKKKKIEQGNGGHAAHLAPLVVVFCLFSLTIIMCKLVICIEKEIHT